MEVSLRDTSADKILFFPQKLFLIQKSLFSFSSKIYIVRFVSSRMVKSQKRFREKTTQTFDPEEFDIHAVERSIREKVLPLKRGEKLAKISRDVRWLKGQTKESHVKHKRSILITLFSNILIPGLGNAYIHASAFSVSILALSMLVMFTTLSPVFPIIQILNATQFIQPSAGSVSQIALYIPANVTVNNQVTLVGPTFSVLIVPMLLSWIHIIFLFVHREEHVEWRL